MSRKHWLHGMIPNPVDACGEWRGGVGCIDASPRIGCSPEHGGAGPALSSGPALIGQRESLAGRRLQSAKDIASNPAPAVVDLLPGPLGFRASWAHQPLARVALAGLRPHLVEADNDTAGRCLRVEVLNGPLFCAKSGSTRAPNQVSSCRHLRPSWMKISLIRLRRMAMPCSLR